MAQKLAYQLPRQDKSEPRSVSANAVSPKIKAKLKEFMSLEPNWDGHQGRAADPAIVKFASDTLGTLMGKSTPEPFLAPGGDGTIQAEWDTDDFTVELHFLSDGKIDACRKHCDTGEWETTKVSAGKLSRISEWVTSISAATTK